MVEMNGSVVKSQPSKGLMFAAFAAVYLIWGSTYLAIRLAIETIPPLLMAGTRFLVSGAILYGWMRARGAAAPTAEHWRSAAIIGLMLLVVGNGTLSWAEQVVPSGIAALLIASCPLWFVGLDWLQRGPRPTLPIVLGLIVGFVGMVVLVDPWRISGGEEVHLGGALALLAASIVWTWGSLYSRRAVLPASPPLGTGMEMLVGGILLLIGGLIAGEGRDFQVADVTITSIGAVLYLVVFGSLIAFTSYIWLLRVSTPDRVSTYAYVNPVVAVFLGWLVLGEPLDARVFAATVLIVISVVLIIRFRKGFRSAPDSKKMKS